MHREDAATGPAGPDPRPHPHASVVAGRARFSWLGPSVLRMEWAEDGVFEDRASLVAVHRRIEPPRWTCHEEGPWTVIRTDDVTVRWRTDAGGFEEGTLEVVTRREGRDVRWRPGTEPRGNLGGTVRTLDGVGGAVDLGPGLLSRDGWVWVDDSSTPLLEGDPPWATERRSGERSDGYLLLHGSDYRAALKDWRSIGGAVPLPPRWALGLWWSRYWPYTDVELLELADAYRSHGIPLDVLVVDMDWHETFELRWGRGAKDGAGQRKGWTGYTWNRAYFPDPEAFLAAARERGLRTALNLHPASGVQPWEERYADVAEAVGVDPERGRYVPFRLEERTFARAFLDLVLRPLERQGVDFWWLDWQQWSETGIRGLTPTMWLNHVFFTEMARRGRTRPIILHRYGGLGSHRYPVGFSGDAASTWEALAFEPELTATAANVLYGYWSHDIGGHEPGPVSAELYTRWIQFGILSPIVRTHTTRHPEAERRPWAFDPAAARAMTEALRTRSSLVPYLYAAARTCHDEGVSIVRPLYHDWPHLEEAYEHADHYCLGPDLVAAPVAQPAAEDGLVGRSVWLPPGAWIEWDSGVPMEGDRQRTRRYALDEMPLFVRAGSVVPRALEGTRAGDASGPLVLSVFPGPEGACRVYEDAGDDLGYLRGELRWTPVRALWSGSTLRVEVGAAEGAFPGAATERVVHVRVHDVLPPARVAVDGAPVPREHAAARVGEDRWAWCGERLEATVRLRARAVGSPTVVELLFGERWEPRPVGVRGLLRRLRAAVDTLQGLWPEDAAPDALVAMAQTGRRMTLRPESAEEELARLGDGLPGAIASLGRLRGDAAVVVRARALLAPWVERR